MRLGLSKKQPSPEEGEEEKKPAIKAIEMGMGFGMGIWVFLERRERRATGVRMLSCLMNRVRFISISVFLSAHIVNGK